MRPTPDLFEPQEPRKEWIDYKLIAAIFLTAILLGAANWSLGRSRKPKPFTPEPGIAANAASPAPSPKPKQRVRPISGRQLTIQKMQQRRVATQHFADDVYGISFDAPQGYVLKEGELSDMDLGLGYLGSIPMEFSEPGGVRVATVEVPRGAHSGTDFLNAFLTVSAFPNTTAEQCAQFSPELNYAQPPLRQEISGVDFVGIPNSEAATNHEYFGKYFHGFSEGTCYEIGYGIVTADAGAQDGLKKTNNDLVLRRLEKILNTIKIESLGIDALPDLQLSGAAGDTISHK
jgi:hypothetical protein